MAISITLWLTADIVTGKLDVRAAAAELPTEIVACEPEPAPEELIESEENES